MQFASMEMQKSSKITDIGILNSTDSAKIKISTETVDACAGLMGFSKCNSLDQHHSRIHTYSSNLEAAVYMSRKSQHRTV
jgi:hypothetical protein